MNCPLCDAVLVMTVRQGVEIDYCQACRGVWLDRGELDKLISLSTSDDRTPTSSRRARRSDASQIMHSGDLDHDRDQEEDRSRHPRKKESFWSSLFDFD